MSEVVKMSLSEKGINLIPLDVDINKIFSLSYTFDNLKLIMNTLLENQNIIYSKIKDLETNISTEKEDSKTRINLLEKKLKTLTLKKEYIPTKKTYENNNTSIKLSGEESKLEKETEKKEEKEENKESKEKGKDSSISFKKKEDIVSPMSGSRVEGQEDDIENDKSNIFFF